MSKTTDNNAGFFTHIHHDGALIEWSSNIQERRDFIDYDKPPEERELRHALIIRVPDDMIPPSTLKAKAAWAKAGAAYDKAWAAYDKAKAACDKAWAAWAKAWAAYDKAGAASNWQSIHDAVCHPKCPRRDPTATDIFVRGKGIEVLG